MLQQNLCALHEPSEPLKLVVEFRPGCRIAVWKIYAAYEHAPNGGLDVTTVSVIGVAWQSTKRQAAVDYFLATQAARWKSLLPMPHNNPGFDIKAVSQEGQDEFIEVKGQSGAWTEDGVALTPTELAEAQRRGERYWLCVVEYATDAKRRTLYLLKNPYGLTQQFRFDSGWKSAAHSEAAVPMKPEAGLNIDLPELGKGRILSLRRKGQFYNLHVILESGRQVNKIFNPATMKLSTE